MASLYLQSMLCIEADDHTNLIQSQNVCRLVSLTYCSGMPVIVYHRRGRWTRDRQVNRPTVGSTDRQRHKQRQVIRNRCSGARRVRQTAAVCCVRGWVTRGDIWVYKRPPAVLPETDDLEGQSWAYTPLWLSLSETTRRLRKDLGGFFYFFLFCGGVGGAACGVVEPTGIPRHYIPFQLPIKPTTVKWLLCVTPSKLWSMGFLWMKGSNKTEQQNTLWFSSCATCSMDSCVLNGDGNGSWKICDSHVFRHQRRRHKTELPCDLWGFFTTQKCDCRMSLKSDCWKK